MPNKKISEFPVTTTIAGSDIFLINHLDTTSTISFSALSAAIATSIPSSGGGDATPIGTVCWFAASAAPTGYLECNGNAVSISLYPDLTTAIYCGDSKNATAQFGYRCTNSNTPSTSRSTAGQFIVLPDLRGEFIRGWDNGRGVDTGRVFGDSQDYTTAIPKNTSPNRLLGDGTTENTFQNSTNPSSVGFARVSKTGENATVVTIDSGDSGKQLDVLNVTVGDSETRPRNVALLPCIKARKTVTGDVSTLNFIEKPANATNGDVLTFNGSTSTWVASSLSSNGFTALLSSNGYQKLPSGLITQWGLLSSVLLDNETWHLVNLPMTFPNQILNASATISYNEYVNGSIGTVIKGLSASGFYVMGDNSNDTKIGDIYWQAIGY